MEHSSAETVYVQIERLCLVSKKSFDEVLSGLYGGISRPNLDELTQRLKQAHGLQDFARIVDSVAGSSGLLEFLRLDLGAALRVGVFDSPYRMIRIIAGNPMIMRSMVYSLPAAGSYAPITILIYQFDGDVHVCYDTVASSLAVYDNIPALQIAKDLDKKVIRLIETAVK